MATQCPRCGRVLNQEGRRCPNCLASLANELIGQREIATHQLREIAQIERDNLWNRHVRKAVRSGALTPLLLTLTLDPLLVAVGMTVGAATGWLVAWRHWGSSRSTLIYTAAMILPLLKIHGFNPFIVLLLVCIGTLIGIAITSSLDT